MSALRRAMLWSAFAVLASACSYDMSAHPSACTADSDCETGAYCYEHFCVEGSSTTTDGGSGHAGSTAGTTGSGTSGSGGGGVGATGDGGSMPSLDGSVPLTDGGTGDAAIGVNDLDGSTATDGNIPVVKEPYAACTDNTDCKSGETCRVTAGKGVCGLPCTSASDCSDPTSGTAVKACGQDDRCKLNCAAKVGSGPPTPRTCPTGMVCVSEIPDPSWLPAEQTCYPN